MGFLELKIVTWKKDKEISCRTGTKKCVLVKIC